MGGYVAVLRKCGSWGDDVKLILWKYFVKQSVCVHRCICVFVKICIYKCMWVMGCVLIARTPVRVLKIIQL